MRPHDPRWLRNSLGIFGAITVAVSATAQPGAADGEWRTYAADTFGSKYSALDQITADNFTQLEVAWRWQTVDTHLVYESEHGASLVPAQTLFDLLEAEEPDRWVTPPTFRRLVATPLMVNGVLYISTPLYQAAAIDATSGETLWAHDPRMYEAGTPAPTPWAHRGVAYWESGGDARIVWGTGDGHLVAVDAKTGLPAADFGANGKVDLTEGLPRVTRGQRDNLNLLPLSSLSAPLVVGDTIIIGSSINDFSITKEMPPGFSRAYDARTGRHKWDFHNVPQSGDEFGSDTWGDESWRYSGNANSWSNMSADPELGIVYLPTSTPTSDYYGGHRPGDNLFAESLVAVDLETGQRVWHFQMVHHGVWDYDNPTAPNLLDVIVDGRSIKAVAQVTKQGFVYAFDRVTGEPVWPIEEREVNTETDLEGERLSPTQPFPTRPAAFDEQGATIDDLVDFTPEIRQMALDAVEGFRLGPLYTPLSLRGTVFRPSA
ncbi:MAG: PQQ-binding-like beta-propeller repeat protein, partial [Acidobacteriota bacterium]|nr:PQQ-binding-like beta-propeller repeat protein [Acidobacteriota bacterium]